MTAAVWPNLRVNQFRPEVSKFCDRCGGTELDTALHCFWSCTANASIEDEALAKTQSLVVDAGMHFQECACLWVQGIVPLSLVKDVVDKYPPSDVLCILASLEARKRGEPPNKQEMILPKLSDPEALFPFSSHVAFCTGTGFVRCARCNQSYDSKHEYVRKWLLTDCPMINSDVDRPRPLALELLHDGNRGIHPTVTVLTLVVVLCIAGLAVLKLGTLRPALSSCLQCLVVRRGLTAKTI